MNIYLNYKTKVFIDTLLPEDKNILANYLAEKIKTKQLDIVNLTKMEDILNLYKLSKVLFIRHSIEPNELNYVFYINGFLQFVKNDNNISTKIVKTDDANKFSESNKRIIKNEISGIQYLNYPKHINVLNVFIDNLESNIKLDFITKNNYFKDNLYFLSKDYWALLCQKHSMIVNYEV